MSKKIISIVLAVMMIMSMVIVGGISTTAADDAGRTIYFDISNKAEWQGFRAYYAYIWGADGEFKAWNGIKMTPVDSSKATEAKLFSVEIPEGNWDLVIFNANAGPQTYDTTFSAECFGDTAYVLDDIYENPVDSAKTAIAAGWKNSKKDGPHVAITSTGKVQGTGILERETPESITDAFITNYAAEMEKGTLGYDNPALITDEARANYIAQIIANTGYGQDDTQPTTPSEDPTTPSEDPTTPSEDPTAPFDPNAHTYTAVGAANIFGDDAWNPSAAAFDMQKDEAAGIWYVNIVGVGNNSEVPFPEDDGCDYKVAADHAWDLSFNETGEAVGLDSNSNIWIDPGTTVITIMFDGTKTSHRLNDPYVPSTEPTTPSEEPTTPSEEPTVPTEEPTQELPTDAPTTPTEAPTSATVKDDPYGRLHGQPMLETMNLPAKDTNRDAYIAGGAPETWDGYFNVYYFAAPADWEGSPEKKAEGISNIGFYWFCGSLNNAEWPGVNADKLVDADGNQITYTVTDADSPYNGQTLNVYYAFAPSFATHIIWNNGISDGEFKADKMQTEDMKVDDPGLNNLADVVYNEADIEAVSVAGCISYIYAQEEVENGLTGEIQTVNKCNFLFFNPRTGESTDKALQVNGEYVLCTENDTDWKLYKSWAESGDYSTFAMNPYFDMNYDFINEAGEIPTQPEPVTLPPAPEDPTTTPTGTAKDPANGTTNGTTSGTSTTTGKVVNTADSAVAVILLTVLVGAMGAVFMARKRREEI